MKKTFLFYQSNIKSLPKGIALIIILIVLILIPVILSLLLLAGITTLVLKGITSVLLPNRKVKEVEYTEYEIIEEKEEKKHIS